MRVAVTTSTFAEYDEEPLRLLRAGGVEIVANPHRRTLTESEAADILRGCAGVVAGTEPLTAAVMDAAPGLKVISRCGSGLDSVDMPAAQARGIQVRNTPLAPVGAVAELTLALALDLSRRITRMDREVRAGTWKKYMGRLLAGKRVGIFGFGRIGRKVAALFTLMGCEVAFHDPGVVDGGACRRMEADALLAWADIVTLHCPPRADGLPLLDAGRLARMQGGALLINAARGGLVDESALAGALQSGKLAGAALDVFMREPYPPSGPLASLPGVILTPHIGAYAAETRAAMEAESVRNLLAVLHGKHG
ncbi:MAG: phosphoglycerate dehydrogenase [Desulfovibrio sp.]|jgi:D-3-phosphoglycerate dehydrogenase|nr:phosphoglycerate dehydrogenase [Desulfovibrio sp.]